MTDLWSLEALLRESTVSAPVSVVTTRQPQLNTTATKASDTYSIGCHSRSMKKRLVSVTKTGQFL